MLRIISTLIIMLISLLTSLVFGQEIPTTTIKISGNVLTEKNEVVSSAIVSLMDANSKKLIKTELTNENGNFTFTAIDPGNYYIKVAENDKIKFTGEPFTVAKNTELPPLILKPEINNLEEVKIVKAKPYIERQQGKIILNVESSIGNTGSSAFEVLEKAPGVNVDNNDNISLRGKTGIVIQIDGKPTPMSGSNLANFLRGMPSGSVDKIEFITNPSSKYDAAGSSIINIKLKKDKKIGTNGSASVALGQGVYPKSNNNLSLNHRNKKINAFGSYSFAYREGFNKLLLDRKFYENDVFSKRYDQDNFLRVTFRNHIARAGIDYYASKKHTFGLVVSSLNNNFNRGGQNISKVFNSNNTQTSSFVTDNRTKDNLHNYAVTLNHKYVIDSLGTELSTDADYASYRNKSKQNFTSRYYNMSNVEYQNPYLLYGDIQGELDIYSLKSDFVKTLKNKVKIETGLKTSYVKADNDLAFYDRSSGTPVYDTIQSNHFIYKENINAAYLLSSKEFGKWNFTLGLRVENTNITGLQVVHNVSFKNNYTQLFPNVLAVYTFNDNHAMEFNYSRRIDRPSYDQLNPFKFYLDPTTYKEGNPYLKPQTTHAFELTHTFRQKFITTLSFSRTKDNITEVIAPSDTDPDVTVQANRNLNTADVYGLLVILPFEVTKWWNMNNSVNFYYATYSGTVANTTLKNEGNFNCNVNSVNNFKLAPGLTAELTANYRTREVYAYMDVDPTWFVNCGFQKKFKNNSSLKLAINDIFYTNKSSAVTQFDNYVENFRVRRDTRTAVLTYTYNFGNGSPSSRRKTGGADDLKQRVGTGNG